MKKILISTLFVAAFLVGHLNAGAQLGGLMNKVKNKLVDKALGNPDSEQKSTGGAVKDDPECACSDAIVVFKFTEGLKINYKEATFSVSEDGTLLVFDMPTKKYYTSKNGQLSGPYEVNDPIVRKFDLPDEESDEKPAGIEHLLVKYKGIIVPSGEKYAINFGGKTYGPYAAIGSFVVNRSKNKFAAMVNQDILMTDAQGAEMERAAKNAKTQQEQMELAMKMSQQMQERMMANGGVIDVMPKLVSNVAGAKMETMMGNDFTEKVKYDDIVCVGYNKIVDLTGKTLFTLDPQSVNNSGNGFWLSSDNSKVASYNYGLLKLSDGKEFNQVFCPYLVKEAAKVYLTYMYFSPPNNAIMQCRLPF